MSLGVLNNLSAIYAENNLNNTSNSLNTVLQQLSSGSKINSGADDAAGLSLVNGLQANSMALAQSQTNAAEGVGLLKVADGALSQVTNLLNRAVTLATEAANGTLNASQDTAANQEYQSILSEINNIGATTTYNQQQVFGSITNIYTGDSSTTGSSIDSLNIRSLSASSVGDTNGVMSYSNGQANVFLNLSSSSANAAVTDTLNASGATTLNVNYVVKGTSGAQTTASAAITVGTGTSYANTVGGMISAINNSGLGLTASFATQASAGVTGGGTQTGIEISGGLVSAGVDPGTSSTSGMLNARGIPAGQLLSQGQVVTVSEGGVQKASVTIDSTTNTLSSLADAINTQAGAGTASVVTNGDGSQSLALADNGPSGGSLDVSITGASGAPIPIFGGATTGTDATPLAAIAGTSVTGNAEVTAVNGSVTFGTSGTNAGTDVLSAGGSITLQNTIPNNTTALTFVVGAGTDTATTFYTANHGDGSNTMDNLVATINTQSSALGASASVNVDGSGVTVQATDAVTGEDVTASANTLTNANNTLGLYNPSLGDAGEYATAALQLNSGDPMASTDNLTGSITISNNGVSNTFIMGGDAANNTATTFYTGSATNTVSDLVTFINDNNTMGLTAVQESGGTNAIYLQASATGTGAITMDAASTLADVTGADLAAGTPINGVTAVAGNYSSVAVGVSGGGLNTNDVLATGGSISLSNGSGNTHVFTIGSGTSDASTTYLAAGSTLSDLAAAITSSTLGVTAQANTNGLSLTSSAFDANAITVNSSTIADATEGSYSTDTLGSFGSANDTISGTLSFTAGNGAKTMTLAAGTTVQSLVDQIHSNSSSLGVDATLISNSDGSVAIKLTSNTEGTAGAISGTSSTSITDTAATADLSYTAASAYNIGLSSSSGNVVYDSTAGQNSTTGAATFVSNGANGHGTATISYSDSAGQDLSSTNLSTQAGAQSALTALNAAITAVAAQDGYIGAQINTLNSVSSVLSTQAQNVTAAQNAVQATDYAAAASNMSKYEILSQTGISALAQANSMQQEVTKLLQ